MTIQVYHCDFSDENDSQAVGELINAYIADEFGGGKPLTADQRSRLLSSLGRHPGAIVMLAKTGSARCGIIVAFENISTFTVRPMLNIHDVFVLKEYRGQGVGRRLMEAITATAKACNASRITLEVRQDNIAAQNLYKSIGFDDTDPPMFFWRRNES